MNYILIVYRCLNQCYISLFYIYKLFGFSYKLIAENSKIYATVSIEIYGTNYLKKNIDKSQ